MASVEQCRTAIDALSEAMGAHGSASGMDRTLSCRATDLDVTWTGRLREGSLHDVTTDERPKAQIRLAMSSDDLVALTAGRIGFASAWATGRLKVEASVLDLLKLRSML